MLAVGGPQPRVKHAPRRGPALLRLALLRVRTILLWDALSTKLSWGPLLRRKATNLLHNSLVDLVRVRQQTLIAERPVLQVF